MGEKLGGCGQEWMGEWKSSSRYIIVADISVIIRYEIRIFVLLSEFLPVHIKEGLSVGPWYITIYVVVLIFTP